MAAKKPQRRAQPVAAPVKKQSASTKASGSKTRPPPDPNSARQRMLAKRIKGNLTPAMLKFREAFITEYLVDFNATRAYLRAGGQSSNPASAGYDLTCEPYVAKAIQDAIDTLEEAELSSRKRVLAGLVREANFTGIGATPSARVAALTRLSVIHGMDPKQREAAAAARGGVIVVPQTEDLGDWEARAAAAQAQLKEEVRK